MLAIGVRRAMWAVVGASAVAFCVVGLIVAVTARAGSPRESERQKLAARLMQLDPGAPVGGNTQVVTAPGARLTAVPGRANFMMALGPRERLMGGPGHDELGAFRADGVRIDGGGGDDLIRGGGGDELLAGGRGNDLIYGGSGPDRLSGGAGNDRIVDVHGASVVLAGSGTNEADVADGRGDDRVVCAPGSTNRIQADRGDRLGPGCHRSGGYRRAPSPAPGAHTAQAISGDGSDASPWTAPCQEIQDLDCTMPLFGPFSYSGLWTTAVPPAIQCPADHPWLTNTDLVPFGTIVPNGVGVQGLGPIGMFIPGWSQDANMYLTGTQTDGASITVWTTGTASYSIQLHCTHNVDNRYTPSTETTPIP
jgi:hypothetical protein